MTGVMPSTWAKALVAQGRSIGWGGGFSWASEACAGVRARVKSRTIVAMAACRMRLFMVRFLFLN